MAVPLHTEPDQQNVHMGWNKDYEWGVISQHQCWTVSLARFQKPGEKPETTVDVGADECDVLGNTDFRPHTWAMWCLSNQWNPNCTLSILYL